MIEIQVKNKIAKALNPDDVIVCGNTDYLIKFTFDAEWNSYATKTARFVTDDGYQEVAFTGNTCNAPNISNSYGVRIGVYAGNLHTTTPAYINCVKSILCGSGPHVTPPTDVYNQLVGMINDVAEGKGDSLVYANNKLKLLSGEEVLSEVTIQGGGGSTAWNDITGKPETFPPSSHNHDERYYTETEIDNKGFITKIVNDLTNYYLKSETYTKTEVQSLINSIKQFTYEVVSVLPTASESTMNKIYLVPSENAKEQNIKNEFITIETSGVYSWEQIGSTDIDLTDYALKSWVEAKGYLTQHQDISGKADKVNTYTKAETDSAISGHHDSTKQGVLTPGTNITIENNVISATGGITIPTVAVAPTQIISQNPIVMQMTDAQAEIIEGNELLILNPSSLGYTSTYLLRRNVKDLTGATIVLETEGALNSSADVVVNKFIYIKSTKQVTWLFFNMATDNEVANGYVAKVDGKGLSTNDYTNADKTKLDGIESGAEVNVIEGVQVGGTDLVVTDKKVNVPVATTNSCGVVTPNPTYGFTIVSGMLRVLSYNSSQFSSKSESTVIAKGTLENIKTDLVNRALLGNVKTTMDTVAVANASYFLGTQTTVSVTMPTDAVAGKEILVCFKSGDTPCTLTVDLEGFSFVPKANKTSWIKFTYIGTDWLVETKEG